MNGADSSRTRPATRATSRTGSKFALGVFVAVLVGVALLPVRSYMSEPRDVIASTPSAFTGVTVPLPVPARGSACADEILYDTNAGIARFGASAPAGSSAPALEVLARGYEEGEFRNGYKAVARVPGGWTGTRQLDVPLRPPQSAAFGTFCVRNLGNRPVELVGTADGRAYSRPSVKVNGRPTGTELELRLMEPGKRSLLSRTGQIMEHASSLRPFGAWWWWLLALAAVVLAPLGVALAMRSALAADAAAAASSPQAVAAWPSERLRRRVESIPAWAMLAAIGAVAVAWFLYWAINTHVFQNDEDQYVYLSRWLQTHFPASLWNLDVYGRGLQRLEVWLLAIPAALFDSPWSLIGGHFLNTVAFVSTLVPVYLLGRGMGLRPHWAVLPAALSVVVPWAVVTTGYLTENIAYPACLWVIWAIWRTTAAPSAGRDALALALLVVAGASRSGLLLLAPVLPLVVVLTGLRCGAGGVGARIRELLRTHIVLWLAVAAAALVLLLGSLGVPATDGFSRRLTGGYATQLGFDPLDLLAKMGRFLSRSVIGTGFLPAAVGLPWLAIQLLRAREPRRFAFALVVVTVGLALLYSLNTAGYDERYIVYLAPLLLLPATLALAGREISPAGLAIASVLLAALVLRVPWNGEQGLFGFFVSPVEMFYARAVGLRLTTYLPGDGGDALTLVGLALGLGGVMLAAILYRAPGRLAGMPAAALVGAVAAVVTLQTHYTLTKYVNGAGSRAAADLNERAFADRAVPKDATVGEFAEGVGQRGEFFQLWQEVQFYNQRIDKVFALGPNVNPVPPGDRLIENVNYDEHTGRLRSPLPLSDYLVIPSQFGTVRVRGEVIEAPAYVAVALIRVAQPATLAWRASGFEPYGVVADGRAGTVRLYGGGLRPGAHCAAFTVTAPPDRGAKFRLDRSGRQVAGGTLAPGEKRNVSLELPRLVERGFTDVQMRGRALQILAVSIDDGC